MGDGEHSRVIFVAVFHLQGELVQPLVCVFLEVPA
mgnify:CR=1 FL=1|jgi:hypothetical protein